MSADPTTAVAAYNGGRPLIMSAVLQQETEQRQLLGQYVQQHMVDGTDYGVIPGTKNKTLLKPGAEKLTTLFRCIPRYVIEEKIENWDSGLFFYRFSCQVVTQADGVVVAEGVGSASTYESRYRWRTADRACPQCGAAAIMRSKHPPKNDPSASPGWYCFGKKGGCGANFDADDPTITEQKTGRVQNPDLADAANTVLKMAKKRALVDAAIALARCSDIFTQDAEDFADHQSEDSGRRPAQRPQVAMASAEQLADISDLLKDLKTDWSKGWVKKRIAEIIGRQLAPNDPPASLTATEAPLVITALTKALDEAKRKASAAKSETAAAAPASSTRPFPAPLPEALVKELLNDLEDAGRSWDEAREANPHIKVDVPPELSLDQLAEMREWAKSQKAG